MIILLNLLWLFVSIFMILVILVQRGRGGGLAGALGGAGGSSAFGTKAGDVFTKITVGVFVVWLLLGLALVPLMAKKPMFESDVTDEPTLVAPTDPTTGGPLGGSEATPSDEPLPKAKSPADNADSEQKSSESETEKPAEPKSETEKDKKPF